jgi:hypothetical protein
MEPFSLKIWPDGNLTWTEARVFIALPNYALLRRELTGFVAKPFLRRIFTG